jgi:hypothetical protein
MKLYDIESYWETDGKWHKMSPIWVSMRKSYAMGAWSILKAFFGKETKYRLVCDGEVIEKCGKGTIISN